ncbi:hypothetical protein H5J25_20080 (plasmid) [Sphingomonas aliaeris]|uniref:DUF4365 domain-containing protein n=1 Tax=Sphingomonas aliaeris TaxID=2759526 RepID=A0A974S712_9SPHN|nr:hypothetical protein [Sphingomonas aliaeris]QQV79390.1 hypothetical protein H5J25_20080 [Sphingomonas aliaeris]
MMTKLTPEQLGDAGEDLFKLLCSQAQLIPNPSIRDRTGWDFRVEFPMGDATATTLDKRLPRVCQVQIKATAGSSGVVTAPLSAVDRLAKDTAPAAIVIFRMRADGTPLMGYVVDLIDDELARILQRLRSVDKAGRTDTNRIKITFDYRKGRAFKPTPTGLREALKVTSPSDVAAYSDKKRHQLATLGFDDDGGIEANALVWIESQDHLMRMISGLAPLKPIKLDAYERRFDILLPYTGSLFDGVDEFPIQLPMVGACEIVVRGGPRDPAALFVCEAFAPPPIDGAPLMVIRHSMMTAVFNEDGLEVETVGHFYEDRHSVNEWILLLRALTYLASDKGSIELEFKGVRISTPRRWPARSGRRKPATPPAVLRTLERGTVARRREHGRRRGAERRLGREVGAERPRHIVQPAPDRDPRVRRDRRPRSAIGGGRALLQHAFLRWGVLHLRREGEIGPPRCKIVALRVIAVRAARHPGSRRRPGSLCGGTSQCT